MKIAIHHREGSFSDRWIAYCQEKGIEYKLVNAYDSDIIQQVKDCDAFMWHFFHADYRDMQMAKALILSLETKGIRCFPDSHTCWHFDNKVWEKYLLEAVGAPLVPSYVFYTEKEAMEWSNKTSFPKVFKLKGGAGASNVKLAHTQKEAGQLIKQCFGKGFSQYRWQDHLKEEWLRYKEKKATLRELLRPVYYAVKRYPTVFSRYYQKEIGYAFFQDFIADNLSDYRIKVVNGNCWGFQRLVRKGDFRASGSGNLYFDNSKIPMQLVRLSLYIAKNLQLQSVAFDYVYDKDQEQFLVVEMSYGFGFDERESENGYWDVQGVLHQESFNPFGWMVESLIRQ